MKENNNLDDLPSELWIASCQIRALGEMLMFQHREPTLDEAEIWEGYGSLIRNIGERLATCSRLLEEEQIKRAQDIKRG